MADSIIGTSIKQLPEAVQSQLNDSTDLIVEDATPTTRRTKLSTLSNWLKTKLGIGTASSLQTTSKEIVGAINELNSSLNTKNISFAFSESFPEQYVYKTGRVVNIKIFGNTKKAITKDTDYPLFVLPDNYIPSSTFQKYVKFNPQTDGRIIVNTEEKRVYLRAYSDMSEGAVVAINECWVASVT